MKMLFGKPGKEDWYKILRFILENLQYDFSNIHYLDG